MNIPVKPVVLIILDGWGIALKTKSNALENSNKPYFDFLLKSYPHTELQAAGEAVGLPHGEDGNSEVGHLNLGAGRIVYENIIRINQSISNGRFIKNQAFLGAIQHVKVNQSSLHLLGLIGSGFVHSSFDHLIALLWLCREHHLKNVYIHMITDGRDSPPHEAATLIRVLQEKLDYIKVGQIASVIGRYYAMDRDLHWERTEKAYDCLTVGSKITETFPPDAIQRSYTDGITDEFITPVTILDEAHKPFGLIKDNDAVIFFNDREDRGRQLTKAFVLPEFEKTKIFRSGESHSIGAKRKTFTRIMKTNNLFFVTMIEYEKNLPVSAVAFPTPVLLMPLAEVLSKRKKRQFHIAETEKYPHVTYFLNGGREDPFKGEDRVLIPSPSVPTYDMKPEMSANEITDVTLERLEMGIYDFLIVSYANPDMVAHTGNYKATQKAIETVDKCLERLISGILKNKGLAIVTSDHGNAEELFSNTGEIDTKHSNNLVPFIMIEPSLEHTQIKLRSGILADVAPTILYLMGIPVPKKMTGINLLN